MKKLAVLAGALCFVFVSCNNKPAEAPANEECTQKEQKQHEHGGCKMSEEQKAECDAFRKQWDDWANLTDDAKKELITKTKARIDQQNAEMEAKMAACKAEWANFDNLTLDEQKALIDKRMQCGKKCDGDKKCCKDGKKDCEKKCEGKKEEGK